MPTSDRLNGRATEPSGAISIGELKSHLKKRGISPEVFAREVQLSHMTIRRWLRRRSAETIPEKYYPVLRPVFAGLTHFAANAPASFDVSDLMNEIEKSGRRFEGIESLDDDVKEKLEKARVDKIFFAYCKRLLAAVKSPKTPVRARAIAIGALIYFVSPIDLIPDHIPVIGYLDDLAVLSLAVNALGSEETDERRRLASKTERNGGGS